MHDPGGGLQSASIRNSMRSFLRAVPNTLICLPGRPPPEASQSPDDMLQTAARAERRRIGPTSSPGLFRGPKDAFLERRSGRPCPIVEPDERVSFSKSIRTRSRA